MDGPQIKGKLLAPAADWLRVMPSGVIRLDVRAVIQTDDDALVFVSYNGVIQCSKEQGDRLNGGLMPGQQPADRADRMARSKCHSGQIELDQPIGSVLLYARPCFR